MRVYFECFLQVVTGGNHSSFITVIQYSIQYSSKSHDQPAAPMTSESILAGPLNLIELHEIDWMVIEVRTICRCNLFLSLFLRAGNSLGLSPLFLLELVSNLPLLITHMHSTHYLKQSNQLWQQGSYIIRCFFS